MLLRPEMWAISFLIFEIEWKQLDFIETFSPKYYSFVLVLYAFVSIIHPLPHRYVKERPGWWIFVQRFSLLLTNNDFFHGNFNSKISTNLKLLKVNKTRESCSRYLSILSSDILLFVISSCIYQETEKLCRDSWLLKNKANASDDLFFSSSYFMRRVLARDFFPRVLYRHNVQLESVVYIQYVFYCHHLAS